MQEGTFLSPERENSAFWASNEPNPESGAYPKKQKIPFQETRYARFERRKRLICYVC